MHDNERPQQQSLSVIKLLRKFAILECTCHIQYPCGSCVFAMNELGTSFIAESHRLAAASREQERRDAHITEPTMSNPVKELKPKRVSQKQKHKKAVKKKERTPEQQAAHREYVSKKLSKLQKDRWANGTVSDHQKEIWKFGGTAQYVRDQMVRVGFPWSKPTMPSLAAIRQWADTNGRGYLLQTFKVWLEGKRHEAAKREPKVPEGFTTADKLKDTQAQ